MPRGQRRGHRTREAAAPPGVPGQVADGDRGARTVIFTKTKMCKFHILGMCSKGTGCKFAHQKEELNPLPDLTRTKLCKTLISTGSCEDPNCCYAHNKEELRSMPEGESEHAQQALAGSANAAASWTPSNQAAFQQIFTGMQAAAMQWAQQQQQQQALPGMRTGTPVAPGPVLSAPAGPSGQAGWSADQGCGQRHEGQVVSLCKGLSLEESAASPEKTGLRLEGLRLETMQQVPAEKATHPRFVIKNTFIDLALDEAAHVPCPRSNTWGAGLSSLGRSDSRDSVPSLDDHESVGCKSPMSSIIPAMPARSNSQTLLECVPEKKRMPTFCGERQFSEESETSAGTPPRTEKRHQDTPGQPMENSSQDSLSTLDEEEAEQGHGFSREISAEAGDYKVKNTFIDIEEEGEDARPLRAVRTANGRLDAMC